MAKRHYDPWKKKSKAGMKSFNTILGTGYKIGKLVTKAALKRKAHKPANQTGCFVVTFALVCALGLMLLISIIN
jgi:hypothetical protein